jgi:hypothetical protein
MNRIAQTLALLMGAAAMVAASPPARSTSPQDERTCFQSYAPYDPRIDIKSDVAIVYGIDAGLPARIESWRERGYIIHVMTGVAWGSYQDYFYGRWDGVNHEDTAQTDRAGNRISHGGDVYYMVPLESYGKYLTVGVKRAIDAGAEAIHLEEPEFWVRAGYSDAFKREWQAYYGEPWQPPDSSPAAQYRASKLKYHLYFRALNQVFEFVRDYSRKIGRPVRCYVPTHSMINYAQWGIVSPESSLARLPGCDGYIAQVWTGTARTGNRYRGVVKERTFETAFLEYGVLHNLVRATGKRVWYLNDPVEDNPHHTWADYEFNYQQTLCASLLWPDVWRYEVMPWPNRVFWGKFPRENPQPGEPATETIPPHYATSLLTTINALNDMKQSRTSWDTGTRGVGVLVSDTMMFQRGQPVDSNPGLDGFYGMALPLLKHGIPVEPVQLENAPLRDYLKPYRVLLLSYDIMKPPTPQVHEALARWVRAGGALVLISDWQCPYNEVPEWWNGHVILSEAKDLGRATRTAYAAPEEHLCELLGLSRRPGGGVHRVGKGVVVIRKRHPKNYAESAQGAGQVRALARRAFVAAGNPADDWREQNYLLLRRGPYIIAAVMDESLSDRPLVIEGPVIDLFDAGLPVLDRVTVRPGERRLLLDLGRFRGSARVLASASRITGEKSEPDTLSFMSGGPINTTCATRVRLPRAPKAVTVTAADGTAAEFTQAWDATTRTLLLTYPNSPDEVTVRVGY